MSETMLVPERIIEVATQLFVSRGYNGISMREIAEAAGLSKAGLYYHCKDKEDLFMAILTANLEHIESLIQAAMQNGSTVREQATLMLQAIFDQSPEQRAIIRLASQEMAHVSHAARASFGVLYQEKFIGQIESILRGGIERGELRPVNVQLATWILLGMAYPFFDPSGEQHVRAPQEAIDLMLDIFFDGLSV